MRERDRVVTYGVTPRGAALGVTADIRSTSLIGSKGNFQGAEL